MMGNRSPSSMCMVDLAAKLWYRKSGVKRAMEFTDEEL
jgi:hypothetical protein